MLKDITLGQYFPGDTIVHRLDARTKLILVVLYIVALFQSNGWVSYIAVVLATAACMALSQIKPATIFKGLKPMLFIIVLTAALNIFYTQGTPIIPGWIITWEGIARSVKMILRIVLLITGTFLLTYTTSPIALTDGLELLLNPLKKIKVPVHEMTMMMSMALRFIPTLIEETDKIMSAQKARGADFESGNLIARAKALVPILVPLFISAFPYCARIVEGSLAEVDKGVIEAAESMGSTTWQIIRKVLVPEAMPSLINGAALCMTTILAYTAMAGSAGGDGLGKIAITYGLNYHEYDIMYVSSLLLVALVQLIQIGGGILTRAVDHRKK